MNNICSEFMFLSHTCSPSHSLLMFPLNPWGVICAEGGYITDESVKAILIFAW